MAPMIGAVRHHADPAHLRVVRGRGRICLHVDVLYGRNAHHIVEAQFKAVARALRDAVALDPRVQRGAEHQGLPVSAVGRAGGGRASVVVLDYGSGNLRSAERALARVGADVTVTADSERR